MAGRFPHPAGLDADDEIEQTGQQTGRSRLLRPRLLPPFVRRRYCWNSYRNRHLPLGSGLLMLLGGQAEETSKARLL